ncbi:DUF3139 domain-containing protein [Solibacillus sp. A46]|uniref:DUF3139 domain-containing protein n=1 Tax=Solibacillus faecavium TaxID=2762221 RepID=A0ABR8Y2U0_9BACL|nr:DUF3139 domain-containing protein [Solibacillus faecavium]MBD8038534.1 DUF3139 domain-containing protein [Solibacillus faecavium]
MYSGLFQFDGGGMSRRFRVILYIAIIVLALIFARFIYIEVNKSIYKNRVSNYLITEMGYDEDEIAKVEGVYGFKMPKFYATVVFKNEPYVEYLYFAHGSVLQFEYQIIDPQYKNLSQDELKNYDPRF